MLTSLSDRNQRKKDNLSIVTICFPHSCCTQSHRNVQGKQQMENWGGGEEDTGLGGRPQKNNWGTETLNNRGNNI